MRKFYLENEIGQRIDLQGQTFFQLPSGLGVTIESEYGRSSDGFFTSIRAELAQGNVVGDLVFRQGYAGYKVLADWLFVGHKIMLIYQPLDTDYLRDIDVESIEKGELGAGGWLTCPASLRCTSPWYKRLPVEIELTPDDGDGRKKYPAAYPMRYALSGDINSADITAGGHIEAALSISIPGPLDGPVITLRRKSTADIIGRVNLPDIEIGADESLLFSSRHGAMGIWRVSVAGREDLIEHVDLTDNNFFRLPVGVPCTLSIGSNAEITQAAEIKVFEYYKAV
ncbi:MAG: hypothetical protein AAGU74_08265 [Bacillota bacterium]